jgi:hypothetical protein
MSAIKNELLNDLSQEELDEMYLRQVNDELEYQQWLESDDYINMINAELEATKPIYSEIDVHCALKYATEQISIDPSEVGKEVYDALFIEKTNEYLNRQNEL